MAAEQQPPETELQFSFGASDALERMSESFARHGDIYRVYMPAQRAYAYVIHHPDDIRRVLVSNHRNYVKGFDRKRIKFLLGMGLMTSEGEFWTRQRYMMQPYFHKRAVEGFFRLIGAANDRLLAQWETQRARGELVNVTAAMSELTLQIVLGSIFGRDTDLVSEQFGIVTKESARDFEFVYKFRAVGALVGKLIRTRRTDEQEHFDFLSMLMAARDKDTGAAMSERQLIDEIMTLVIAGHETTASVLNWTWYFLSQHPQVEARVHLEISQCKAATPGLEHLENLDFTHRVLKETMRLYPPGWLLSRAAIGPDTLGGYNIPAGANVLVPLYLVHRHPRFWKDPGAFLPERFTPEQEAERPRFAYVPFAAGPRHCIGETFAVYEMLLHLCKIVPTYRLAFVADKPLELEAQINLRTRHPLYMHLEHR